MKGSLDEFREEVQHFFSPNACQNSLQKVVSVCFLRVVQHLSSFLQAVQAQARFPCSLHHIADSALQKGSELVVSRMCHAKVVLPQHDVLVGDASL